MQNHFELFNLPAQFKIEMDSLDQGYREIQHQVHPDRFSTGGEAEKRVATQWAARANEAYETLKKPLSRAIYLCELNGVDCGIESNTAMSVDFLMQQMAWREELDEIKVAGDMSRLQSLNRELDVVKQLEISTISSRLDQNDYASAALATRQLMFVEKFGQEIDATFDILA
jgi:molecular chaperone HscB